MAHGPIMTIRFRSKAQRADTWDVHSQTGYYVGLPLDHYRCHEVILNKTGKVVVSDTLNWYPKEFFLLPVTSTADNLIEAINLLINAVSSTTILNKYSTNTQKTLRRIASQKQVLNKNPI